MVVLTLVKRVTILKNISIFNGTHTRPMVDYYHNLIPIFVTFLPFHYDSLPEKIKLVLYHRKKIITSRPFILKFLKDGNEIPFIFVGL